MGANMTVVSQLWLITIAPFVGAGAAGLLFGMRGIQMRPGPSVDLQYRVVNGRRHPAHRQS